MERLFTLTAHDLMHSPVQTLRDDLTLHEAAAFLFERGIHGAPVEDRQGRVVGVISATDLARWERDRDPEVIRESDWYRLLDAGEAQDVPWDKGYHLEVAERTRVRDVMTPKVISVREDAHLGIVLSSLVDNHIHRVIVLSKPSEKLLGVITTTDVLKALLSEWIRRC